jgi:hypothetical protein
MIKCGAIAAIVIAGGAAGTASLVSYSTGTERVAADGQEIRAQEVSQRGTRSPLMQRDSFSESIGTQPRRGERPEYETISLAMVTPAADGIRRGSR